MSKESKERIDELINELILRSVAKQPPAQDTLRLILAIDAGATLVCSVLCLIAAATFDSLWWLSAGLALYLAYRVEMRRAQS